MKIKDALHYGATELGNSMESRILLCFATDYKLEYLLLHPDEILLPQIMESFYSFVERRKKHEPIAYILGYKEFYGRDFVLNKNVLIPRSDSETLIDAVISDYKDQRIKILELGIGSGCLLMTLLLEIPDSIGEGLDISAKALDIAKANMEKHNLSEKCKLYLSNWFENVYGKFDVIICNPPYIDEADQEMVAKETSLYEPKGALYARNNGYEAYEIIASNIANYMKPEASIYLEIGLGQEKRVTEIFVSSGFTLANKYKDLQGIVRVLKFVL